MNIYDSTDPLFRPISIEDAMARTRRSRRTIDRWIHDGRLRTFNLENPPETVLIERDLVALEKQCRDARATGRPPKARPEAA